MAKKTAFVPSTKRGAELAREVLNTIEAEETLKAIIAERKGYDSEESYEALRETARKGNAWNQGVWGTVYLDDTPPNTTVEVLPDKIARKSDNYEADDPSDFIVAFDQPVTCGTAMCFAGHVTYAVGDRFVANVWNADGKTLPKGETVNAKRTLKSFVDSYNGSVSVDEVMTSKGKIKGVSQRAAKLLGLDWHEADVLFNGNNDLDRLRTYVEMMEKGLNLLEDYESYVESKETVDA